MALFDFLNKEHTIAGPGFNVAQCSAPHFSTAFNSSGSIRRANGFLSAIKRSQKDRLVIQRSCIHDPAYARCLTNVGPRAHARSVNIMLDDVTIFSTNLYFECFPHTLSLFHPYFDNHLVSIDVLAI